jgi:hypothetical protein
MSSAGSGMSQPTAIIPKRRRRWALMIGIAMLYTLTLPALVIFLPRPAHGFSPAYVMAFLPLFVVLPQSPFARLGWLRESRFLMFDEFERGAIALATRRAYTIVVLMLAALFAWLWLAAGDPTLPAPRTELQWSSLGASLIMIVVALPIFFAELMVPMPPADDIEEMVS